LQEKRIDLKIPCPNCGSKEFGTMNEPYCILPSIAKNAKDGYEIIPERGLVVLPVICDICGYILFFHPQSQPQKID